MPRAVSARKGERSRAPMPVKGGAKKAGGRADKGSKANGSGRAVAAKPTARNARGSGAASRTSERTVQAGRTLASPETVAGASRGKYVYCIIEAQDPLDRKSTRLNSSH